MCFVHFDLDMCFAPQWRALFATSQLLKVFKNWCFVHFDLDMCFAPQRRAIFHLSPDHMAPHPPLWRAYFSTPPGHKPLEKQCFATFLPFRAPGSSFFGDFLFLIFFLLLFSSLTLPISAFDLSILSEVWLLNFPRLHITYHYILLPTATGMEWTPSLPPVVCREDMHEQPV